MYKIGTKDASCAIIFCKSTKILNQELEFDFLNTSTSYRDEYPKRKMIWKK